MAETRDKFDYLMWRGPGRIYLIQDARVPVTPAGHSRPAPRGRSSIAFDNFQGNLACGGLVRSS